MCLTHIYNFKFVFNFTVTRLSWLVLYYLISKNLYSLQNAQPFIFQLICMQLYKYLNFFLKSHNKHPYYLNFTIFFTQEKKFLKMVQFRVESWVNPFLLQVKEIGFGLGIFRVGSGFELFCHVYNQAY